jgi:hypothetical protein
MRGLAVDDRARVQRDPFIGGAGKCFDLVRNHDQGCTTIAQESQQRRHCSDGFCIDIREWLVKQKQIGRAQHGARQS